MGSRRDREEERNVRKERQKASAYACGYVGRNQHPRLADASRTGSTQHLNFP